MNVDVTNGKLTITASVKSEERLLFAMTAAWQAFDAVMSPVIGEAVRYSEDDSSESNLHQKNPLTVSEVEEAIRQLEKNKTSNEKVMGTKTIWEICSRSLALPPESNIHLDTRTYQRPVIIVRIPVYAMSETYTGVVELTDDEIDALIAWATLNRDLPRKSLPRRFFHEADRKSLLPAVKLDSSELLHLLSSRIQKNGFDKG